MLKAIAKAMRPEGYFVCQFHLDTSAMFSHKKELFKKAFAFMTLGNFWYERGDMLWGGLTKAGFDSSLKPFYNPPSFTHFRPKHFWVTTLPFCR